MILLTSGISCVVQDSISRIRPLQVSKHPCCILHRIYIYMYLHVSINPSHTPQPYMRIFYWNSLAAQPMNLSPLYIVKEIKLLLMTVALIYKEVVKLLGITVPSGAIVPTTVTGVPLATTWPGKSIPPDTASPPSTTSASTSSASANPNSTLGNTTQSANSAMKTGPSSFLAVLASIVALTFLTTHVEATTCDSICNEDVAWPDVSSTPQRGTSKTSTDFTYYLL